MGTDFIPWSTVLCEPVDCGNRLYPLKGCPVCTSTSWELTLSPEALSCVNRCTVGTDLIHWRAVLCEPVHRGNRLYPLKHCPVWTGTPWELTLSPEALSCVNRYTVGTDFIPWSAVLCEQVHHGNWLSPLKGCPVWTSTPWELTLSLKRCPVCTGASWELTLSTEGLSCVNKCTMETQLYPLKGCPVWTGTPWELTLSLKRCPMCTGASRELTLSTEGLSCVNRCTVVTNCVPWSAVLYELVHSRNRLCPLKRCPVCTSASWELTLSTEGLSCVNRCTVVTNFVPWRTVLCELVHRWNWLYPLKRCPVCSSFCFSLRDSSPFHRDWDQHFPTPSSPWCGRFELLW